MARGMAEYEAGRYAEAIRVFEHLSSVFPGYGRMPEVRFYLADSYLEREEYLTAATEFVRLANDYPTSPLAADARFKVCQAYYELSPRPELDQQYTYAAIEHCRALVTYYPTSEHVAAANQMIRELRNKLARKEFLAGESYFRHRMFDSALIYYESVLADYPDTDVAPRALFRIMEAYNRIGWTEEAEEARERLIRDYPTSEEAGLAREISVAGGS